MKTIKNTAATIPGIVYCINRAFDDLGSETRIESIETTDTEVTIFSSAGVVNGDTLNQSINRLLIATDEWSLRDAIHGAILSSSYRDQVRECEHCKQLQRKLDHVEFALWSCIAIAAAAFVTIIINAVIENWSK